MRETILDLLVCPQCKESLKPVGLRRRSEVLNGVLQCAACHQAYPIVAGVPSLFPDPHPFPIWFLPPDDILSAPKWSRKHGKTNALQLTLEHYGKARFMQAIRHTAKRSRNGRRQKFHLSRSVVLNETIKREAYRFSRESYIRRVTVPLMKRHWWPDKQCVAMVKTLQELKPERLLDIATGPGAFVCRALPRLKRTTAVGLEIYFEKCRLVLSEAVYFGFRDRIEMIHGDARLMPLPDCSFDCVSGLTAAYHISRYEEAVRESARVLRTGGHFVGTFQTTYPSHCPKVLTRSEEEEFIRRAHLPLNIREVCEVFRDAGFVVAKEIKIGNSHLIVARKR